jgi:hypothetical protein
MGGTGVGKSSLLQWVMKGGEKIKTWHGVHQIFDSEGKPIVSAGSLESVTKIDTQDVKAIMGNRYTLRAEGGPFKGQVVHAYDMPGFGDTKDVVQVCRCIEEANALLQPLGYIYMLEGNIRGSIPTLQKHSELFQALTKPADGKDFSDEAKKFFLLMRGNPGDDQEEADAAVHQFKSEVAQAPGKSLAVLKELIAAGCHVMAVTVKAGLADCHNEAFMKEITSLKTPMTTESSVEYLQQLAKHRGNKFEAQKHTKFNQVVEEQVKDYKAESIKRQEELEELARKNKADRAFYQAQIDAEKAKQKELVQVLAERERNAREQAQEYKRRLANQPGFWENILHGLLFRNALR